MKAGPSTHDAASPATNTSGAAAAGVSANAGALGALAMLADSNLKADLSPPAIAIAAALDSGLGELFGLGKGLTSAGIDALSDAAGDIAGTVAESAADIVSDVTQSIPVLGMIIGAIETGNGAVGAEGLSHGPA